ncbi:MAG: YdcF family protein [Pseudomonadota bacterium]
MTVSSKERELAKQLWDYNYIRDVDIGSADLLLVMGSNDLRVPHYAAEIAKQYSFDFTVCSGSIAHCDDLLSTGWDKSEAEIFADIMQQHGVENIIQERKATNTGENLTFTKQVLQGMNVQIQTGVLVQKPFMLRRVIATAKKQWPEVKWKVTAQDISYEDYVAEIDETAFINILVGDTQRVIDYAQTGFQIEQNMPDHIVEAKDAMIELGYNRHLPQ